MCIDFNENWLKLIDKNVIKLAFFENHLHFDLIYNEQQHNFIALK